MRIKKFGHSCVRIEHDGHTLVLDPGMFTDPEAMDGADAVLITHQHYDPGTPSSCAGSTRRSTPSPPSGSRFATRLRTSPNA